MQKSMDIDNIFGIFDKNDQTQQNENQRLVDHFKDHPLVKIGHFKKLILNYNSSGKKIIELIQKSNKDLSLDDVKKAGEFLLFNKAYENISVIKIDDPFHIECLNQLNGENKLKKVFKKCIKHFEKNEEYEKCGFLKSLQDKLGNPK